MNKYILLEFREAISFLSHRLLVCLAKEGVRRLSSDSQRSDVCANCDVTDLRTYEHRRDRKVT